jgi:hypothetical protein
MEWSRSVGALLASLIVVSGSACETGDAPEATPTSTIARFDPIGTSATPAEPFVAGTLPPGWKEGPGQTQQFNGVDRPSQAVFTPPTTSASSGPALLIGYVVDDEGTAFRCDLQYEPNLQSARIVRMRRDVTAITIRGPDFATTNCAYVMGRDVSDVTLRRAAASVQWPESVWEPPTTTLPHGYQLRATSAMAFSSIAFPILSSFSDGSQRNYIVFGQADSNAAGIFVAGFWRSVIRSPRETAQRILISGHTIVRLEGKNTPATRKAVAVIERNLRRTP